MAPPDEARTPPRRRWFVLVLAAVLVGVSTISVVTNLRRMPAAQTVADTGQKLETLTITTASGTHAFRVEVMRTGEERARGLMFRQTMPADQGMLFDFTEDQPVSMWMKNTYLALDMVFITKDGRVHRVAERTEPLSERTIPSGAPVRAVLELNAGTAARIGLKPGDRVQHPVVGG